MMREGKWHLKNKYQILAGTGYSVDGAPREIGMALTKLACDPHLRLDLVGNDSCEDLFFNALDGAVNLLGADRALAQGQVHGCQQLDAFKLYSTTVFFDDGRVIDIRALVRGKAFVTCTALAAAADKVAVFGNAGLDDLAFRMAAKRTFHDIQARFFGV